MVQMSYLSLYIFIITIHNIANLCAANDNFYIIAHMVNVEHTVEWAMQSGANAVEMDMHFDDASGRPTRFQHGTPCDCTCYLDLFIAGSVCHIANVCKGISNVEQHLQSLLKFQALALIYIDSKAEELSVDGQKKAGREVINTVEKQLFAKGYRGVVLISGNVKEYILSASTTATRSQYVSRIYFTVDQDRSGVPNNLHYLASLPVPNIIYSTGISACAPTTYYDEVRLASINKGHGVVSNVFIWTLDKTSSFESYFSFGARGILTNKVPELAAWAKAKGLRLATPGDESLPAATTKTVVQSLGSCDCDYHPGGCSISHAAPANSACQCIYKGAWTCGGTVVGCRDSSSLQCRTPDKTPSSCIQGSGDCGGYGTKNCDCDYHPGGCTISKTPPKDTACRCLYKGGWTCSGDITTCVDQHSPQCTHPDKSSASCSQGGGDCGGY